MIFGLFKKREPPTLRPEMLQPVDAPISAVDAKRLFKQWMVQIGYLTDKDKLDRLELNDHVEYLAQEMKEHEQGLKDELAEVKVRKAEEIRDLKGDLSDLKKDLKQCADASEKAALEAEILQLESTIAAAAKEYSPEADALEKFKSDKRLFLVDYINRQVHGPDWQSKL